MPDNIQRLRNAGFKIPDNLEPEYKQALNGLKDSEVDGLIKAKTDLDKAQTKRNGEPPWQERVVPL